MKQELKHTELRCGNLVYNPNLKEIRTVDYLDIRDHAEKILYTPFEGIELNPEWLERFGLIKEGEGKYAKYYQGVALFGYWTADGSVNVGQFIPQDVKFVHQLQNLFFALTGRELELKK